jgi:3-oxoacyl-[acyl-carrier-protein] synthase II
MNLVITGQDVLTAAGRGVPAIVELLHSREHAFREHPPYESAGLTSPQCAIVADLDRGQPACAALRAVVQAALAEAQLDPQTASASVGLVVGTTSGNISGPWEAWHRAKMIGEDADERGTGRESPTQQVAQELGLTGPTATVSVACASGTAAFAIAAGWLQDGAATAVVVAGVDALSLYIHAGFNGLGALSKGFARPFHAERDGLTLGEGAAAVVLEHAGDREILALATLLGVGLAGDATHISAPHREGRGAAEAMQAALQDAAVSADLVDILSVHGTATVFNDAMEAHAIRRVFGDRPLALHGTKHAIGHTMGAAGTIEAAVVVDALVRGIQPPAPTQIALDLPILAPPDPPHRPTVALSTSSAFGGSNAAIALSVPGRVPTVMRHPVGTRQSDMVRVDLPPGRIDWSAHWPDAPDRFKRLNRYVRTGMIAVKRLFDTLGWVPGPETGIVLASPSGCRQVDLRYHERLVKRGAAQASRLDFVYTIPGAPAAEAAIQWNLRGPPLALIGPMDQAIEEAARLIRWGRATRLVALGIDVPDASSPAVAQACLLERA